MQQQRFGTRNASTAGAAWILPLLAAALLGCANRQAAPGCEYVEDGFGPTGGADVRAEVVVAGLEVPWSIAFLPNGDLLVTERPGALRLVRDVAGAAELVQAPVAELQTASTSEGGLLGLALHPDFAANRLIYLYVTTEQEGEAQNQVERWRLSDDGTRAERESIIFSGIPAARYHNGGRIRFGPDGMLYVGTGDAGQPGLSQDPSSPAGKLLRLTLEGKTPGDNPIPGSPAFLLGIRNTQGWDWPDPGDASLVWLSDHGPSGERLRRGHDEVTVARAGDNLGWPTIYGCEEGEGLVAPAITWRTAVPPGGAAIYTGDAIPEWRGSLLVGTLRSQHLHRIAFEDGAVSEHEVYFRDELGRLRDVMMGPDGDLYVTTSNCDGRGTCPPDGDRILRIRRAGR